MVPPVPLGLSRASKPLGMRPSLGDAASQQQPELRSAICEGPSVFSGERNQVQPTCLDHGDTKLRADASDRSRRHRTTIPTRSASPRRGRSRRTVRGRMNASKPGRSRAPIVPGRGELITRQPPQGPGPSPHLSLHDVEPKVRSTRRLDRTCLPQFESVRVETLEERDSVAE